jgi:hypothetical protein
MNHPSQNALTRFNTTQRTLLTLLSGALFGNPIQLPDEINWPEVVEEAKAQAVLPLAFHQCSALPQELIPAVQKEIRQILAANMTVEWNHLFTHELMTAGQIPYVILKGCASARYYPEPIYRTMGDVDFLVHPSDIPKAASVLESNGFEQEEDDDGTGIHIGYQRDGSIWEMHRSVNEIPEGETGALIQQEVARIIETAVDYHEGNGVIRIPDAFHHGLVLLLHTASHLLSEGVGLRHLCDWAVFVNHFTDAQFVDLFQDKLEAYGLWRFAQLLSLTSVQYLKLPYRSWMGEADQTVLEQLMADIMDSGNFGHKDEDRRHQIKYISNRDTRTVDERNVLVQIWDNIGRKAKANHTSRGAVITDYLVKVLKGERKLDGKSTLASAAERKKLYSELHLFEP